MIYKLVRDIRTNEINVVNKIMDNRILSIPFVDDNTDYQEFLQFLADGGVPEPADTPEEAE